MSSSRIMKWVTGGLELLLGIPVLGGSIVISLVWTPLGIMLALHIVTLILSKKYNEPAHGSVLGIVTSLIAWIPFLGMVMHLITAIFLMISAAKEPNQRSGHPHAM